MKRLALILLPISIALVLLVLAIAPLASASPPQAVSPRVVLINSEEVAITGTQTYRKVQWVDYTKADLFWELDMDAGVNTTTVTIFVSVDGVTWVAHGDTPTPVDAAVASVDSYLGSLLVEGYYVQVRVTTENALAITPKLKWVLR